MQGEIFLATSPMCIRFWYSMDTNKAINATLNIWKINFNPIRNTLLWSMSYGQNLVWKEARLSFRERTRYSIMFEAVKGYTLGDVAIDDIEFYPLSECTIIPLEADPVGPTTTRTTMTTTKSTTPQGTTYTWKPQSQYDCNFEQDFCGWENDTTAEFFWKRNKGTTGYPSTGFI
jgi:hypothetical protein